MLQHRFSRTLLIAFAIFAQAGQVSLAQQVPTHGGTLVFGINSGDPPTYDCHQSTLFPIVHLLTPHYSNLLRIDLGNYPNVVGDLAES
jgi:peptide/nickel transport system substrate-binding protein